MIASIFQAFGKIERCSRLTKKRIWLQMLIITLVAAFEALFIFLLIPFLEVFGQPIQSTHNASSYVAGVVNSIFTPIGLSYNLNNLAICLGIMACLRETFSAFNQVTSQMLIGKIEKGIQEEVVRATLSATFLHTLTLGNGRFMELCSICSRESAKVAQSVLQIFSIFITLSSYFLVLILTSPTIASIALLLAICAVLCLNFTAKRALIEGGNIIKTREILSQQFHNVFSHLREIKINNQNEAEYKSINQNTEKLFDFTLKSVTIGVWLRSALTVVLLSSSLYLVVVLKNADVLDLAILTAGLAMVMRLLPLILNFTRIRQGFAANYPYLERLEKYLLSCRKKREFDQGETYFEGVREKIEFRNVVFTYPSVSKPALNGLNLTIKKGRSIALTGSSGAGKSTLIDLLPKLIDVGHGNILIDGEEINSFSLKSLREGIAYLPQNPSLHDGSIRYNICFSDDPQNDDQIKRIISDVGLEELVKNLPDQLDTQLGSTALKLSGGQCQRLAIARALFKKSDIFIFDEPTSALDAENADIVSSLIADLARKNKSTVLVISHSWETISKLDYMVKLKDGRIAFHGKPDKKMMGLSVTNTNNQKD